MKDNKPRNPPIELHDDDPCPFPGRYCRTKMEDLPARFLNSYWHQAGKLNPLDPISDWIRRKRRWLESLNPDLIWD